MACTVAPIESRLPPLQPGQWTHLVVNYSDEGVKKQQGSVFVNYHRRQKFVGTAREVPTLRTRLTNDLSLTRAPACCRAPCWDCFMRTRTSRSTWR